MADLIPPDIEVWLTDWLRINPRLQAEGILPVAAGRLRNISTELPKPMEFPWVTARVVPGGLIDSGEEGGFVQQLMQVDTYGADAVTLGRESSPDWTNPSRLIRVIYRELVTQNDKIRILAPDGDHGWAYGWSPISVPFRVPEPETHWAHMSFSALLSLSGEE